MFGREKRDLFKRGLEAAVSSPFLPLPLLTSLDETRESRAHFLSVSDRTDDWTDGDV